MTLLIDGVWSRSWILRRMKCHLEEHFGEVEIYFYDTSGRTGIDVLGQQLADYIVQKNKPLHIVAFSMGGLVVRAAHQANPELKIQRAVFLNTPHKGSLLAYSLPLPALRQMRPGGKFLGQLETVPWHIPTMVVWCPGDLMVVPGWNAKWTKAKKSHCCWIPAHIWPLISKKIHKKIVTFLKNS